MHNPFHDKMFHSFLDLFFSRDHFPFEVTMFILFILLSFQSSNKYWVLFRRSFFNWISRENRSQDEEGEGLNLVDSKRGKDSFLPLRLREYIHLHILSPSLFISWRKEEMWKLSPHSLSQLNTSHLFSLNFIRNCKLFYNSKLESKEIG